MKTGLLINQILNEFYRQVVNHMPFGTTKRGFPLLIGKVKVSVIIFDVYNKEVSFGIFVPRKRYSRKTLCIYESGIVIERDSKGVIPDLDLTPHEPDLSKLTNTDIAVLVALQLKTLGYTNYTAKKSKY